MKDITLKTKNQPKGIKESVGFWPRLMAHNVDLVILLPIYYLLSLLITNNTFLFAMCILFTYIFEVLFTVSTWRGTPGKYLGKIEVVNSESNTLTFYHSAIRSLTKVITIVTLFIGYLIIILRQDHRSLHDLLAGSWVIFKTKN